jgi:DNA-directed RNA polymerase subunit RPC12/RpoP
MPAPVCLDCNRLYRPHKNGEYWIETKRADEPPYADGPPYKVWHSDRLKCPACGHEILTGHGRNPAFEQSDAQFADEVKVPGRIRAY